MWWVEPESQPPPPPSLPSPGWYADPTQPGKHRWWDGSQWGDKFIDSPNSSGNRSNETVGGWLGRSFTVGRERIGHFLTIFVVILLPGALISQVLLLASLKGISISMEIIDEVGSQEILLHKQLPESLALPIGMFGVSLVISTFSAMLALIAFMHQGNAAVTESPVVWSASVYAAIGRIGRLLVVMFVYLGSQIVHAGAFFLVTVTDPRWLWLLVITVPLHIWAAIRFSMTYVACILVGEGKPWIRPTWGITRGRVWMMIGRYLLLGLVSFGFSIAANLLSFPFAGGMATNNAVQSDSTIVPLFDFSELNPVTFILQGVISNLASGASMVIAAVGMVLIYRSLGGDVGGTSNDDELVVG